MYQAMGRNGNQRQDVQKITTQFQFSTHGYISTGTFHTHSHIHKFKDTAKREDIFKCIF